MDTRKWWGNVQLDNWCHSSRLLSSDLFA